MVVKRYISNFVYLIDLITLIKFSCINNTQDIKCYARKKIIFKENGYQDKVF